MNRPGILDFPGRMVVIEGGDACGKATQTKWLVAKLESIGLKARLFSFPRYDTEIGSIIGRCLRKEISLEPAPSGETVSRADAVMLQALMTADKCSAAREINELLSAGTWVVCDRWLPSAIVYGGIDGLDVKVLKDMAIGLRNGDWNLLLDVPVETAMERRPIARDRYEISKTFRTLVRASYWAYWKAERKAASLGRWETINGALSESDVSQKIFECIYLGTI